MTMNPVVLVILPPTGFPMHHPQGQVCGTLQANRNHAHPLAGTLQCASGTQTANANRVGLLSQIVVWLLVILPYTFISLLRKF